MLLSQNEIPILFTTILLVLVAICTSPQTSLADTAGEPTDFSFSSESIVQRLTLSPDEQAWLAKKPTIRVRIGAAPPFHSWEDGDGRGISVDYMRLFCEGFGLRCVFFSEMPWSEAIENIGAGKDGDLILTVKYTSERSRLIAFTQDYLHLPWVIFARNDSPFIGGIEDLEGKTIAMESGFALRGLLERDYPGIQLHIVATSRDAIEALAAGQVDAYIGNLTIGTYLVGRWGFTNVKVAAPTPFGSHNQAMGVRKDWPELVSLMDRFQAVLSPKEHSEIKNRWLSIRYEHGIDWSFIWKLGGAISSVATLVIMVIVFWNLRLRKEIILRKNAEEKLLHMATHDSLTGLPTRLLCMDHIASALASARRNKVKAAVLFIDLDGFKSVNDTMGHEAGDRLLVSVGERLVARVREVDTVARFGGDEFMVVLVDIDGREDAAIVAEKLIDVVSRPFLLSEMEATIGASIGIALYPDHAQEPEPLVQRADTAMYTVKERGRNGFSFAEE